MDPEDSTDVSYWSVVSDILASDILGPHFWLIGYRHILVTTDWLTINFLDYLHNSSQLHPVPPLLSEKF